MTQNKRVMFTEKQFDTNNANNYINDNDNDNENDHNNYHNNMDNVDINNCDIYNDNMHKRIIMIK